MFEIYRTAHISLLQEGTPAMYIDYRMWIQQHFVTIFSGFLYE